MAYKYNFTDNMYVAINSDKFKKAFFKKHSYRTGTEVLRKEGFTTTSSGLSTSINRGIINYGILKALCRDVNVKPATFITSSKPASDKNVNLKKKAPVKKAEPKKKKPKAEVIKEETPKFTGDGSLNVSLKKSSNMDDLVTVLGEIRDSLRELVEELK